MDILPYLHTSERRMMKWIISVWFSQKGDNIFIKEHEWM